jgi:hypothetical protein
MIPYAANRSRYVSTGKVAWSRFLPLAGLALLSAAAVAKLLQIAYASGYYWLVWMPIMSSMALAALVVLAINIGRCRNRGVAVALGILVALVLYLGYYYASMVEFWGSDYLTMPDRLPSYIWFRLNTDTKHPAGSNSTAPGIPDFGGNVLDFVFESGAALLILGLAANMRAGRAFCESCGHWKNRSVAFFPPNHGRAIAQLLDTNELSSLVQMPRAAANQKKGYTAAAVEFCGNPTPACQIFFAVKDVNVGGGVGQMNQYDLAIGRRRVKRVILFPAEIAAVAPVFPELAKHHPEAASTPIPTAPPAPSSAVPRTSAAIEPLPAHDQGQILNGWSITLGNILGISILLFFVGGIAVASLGIGWAGGAMKSPVPLPASLAIAIVSVLVVIACAVVGLRNPSYFGNRYLRARAARVLRRRPHRLVDPDDRDAFFVDIVPRKNWYRLMLENAEDIGFVKIDFTRRQLLFEGDHHRYRIPADAIESATVEQFAPGQGSIVFFALVVRAQVAGAPWEAPICVRSIRAILPAKHREIAARELHSRIATILPEVEPLAAPAAREMASAAPMIEIPPPARGERMFDLLVRWWRIPLIVGIVLIGIIAGLLGKKAKRFPGPAGPLTVGNAGRGPTLAFTISNIRPAVRFSTTAPYFQPGGTWTAFDCSFEKDSQAMLTVAVAPADPKNKTIDEEEEIPVHFAKAAIVAPDRATGERILGLFGAEFAPAPVARSPQALKPMEVPIALLGEKLARTSRAFTGAGTGTWTATKFFFSQQGYDGEVFFNFDLTNRKGEFADKDPDYDKDLVAVLALALRDGPRPARTAQNDPTFTVAGPRIADLHPIANSEGCSIDFLSNDLALLKHCYRKPSSIHLIDLKSPEQKRLLVQSADSIEDIAVLDDHAGKLAYAEVVRKKDNVFETGAPRTLWLYDRKSGEKRRLQGSWPAGAFLVDQPRRSSDARFIILSSWDRQSISKATLTLHFHDLTTGKTVAARFEHPARLAAWVQRDGLEQALFATQPLDGSARRHRLVNPVTGTQVAWAEPLPPAADPTVAPGGARGFALDTHEKIDIVDLSSQQIRTFSFHEDDQRFAEAESLRWLSPRFIEFPTVRPGVIDAQTLKHSYFADADQHFTFSADFRWAAVTKDKQIHIGRVVLPE